GYARPDSGTVYVGGERIGQDIAYPRSLGLILEAPGFLPQFSGAFNLQLLLSIRNRPNKALIADVMARVGLAGAENKAVGKYSMGMRQRLGIAQAIMEDPALLILDEPFNGLDQQGVADMHTLLKDLRAQGKTILLTSHYAQDIDTLCDTISRMEAGTLQKV
ncbi:MAG TPA: ATP-binding cassette domain-containing protein, partial [Clostridiales bacterium]|nr:ATP-binding cassette domain-containing protein [Clostridiales bacterium]